MTQNTVQQIEDNIKRNRSHVELDKSLERLESNRDFKKVIVEGYLETEAVRLVHLKSDPAMQTPERQASIITQIDSIGGLMQYFRTVSFNAKNAMKSIEADEATRDEILAEEV